MALSKRDSLCCRKLCWLVSRHERLLFLPTLPKEVRPQKFNRAQQGMRGPPQWKGQAPEAQSMSDHIINILPNLLFAASQHHTLQPHPISVAFGLPPPPPQQGGSSNTRLDCPITQHRAQTDRSRFLPVPVTSHRARHILIIG